MFLEKNSNKDPVQTTQAAGFKKNFKIRLQSNGKNWPSELGQGGLDQDYPMFTFVGCGIKPGCSSACCGAKNSDTEILMKAFVQKHKNYDVFSKKISPRCALTFK